MTPGLIQRHHDYVLGPNQDSRLASVAAGANIQLALQLDSDAPFVLRSRAMRVAYSAARLQLGLNHLLMRWSRPDRVYTSQNYVRQSLYAPYFGQIGNPIPVSPEIFYPRQGSINVDIINDGATALTNLTLYFRGVKLFSPGATRTYEYPAKFGILPFVYPQGRYSDTDGLTLVRNVLVVQGPLRQTFRVKADADFVLRGGQAGLPFSTTPVNEVFITLRDQDEKAYSNDAVHMDVMFGNSDMGALISPTSAGPVTPIACGPNSPGLFYPEIYVPKNQLLYFDVTRNDAAYAGATTANIPFSFIGQKVFVK